MQYRETVYLFATGKAYELLGTGNQFPYQRFGDAGLSLDSNGTNLPQHKEWRYVSEHQSGRPWGIPVMEKDEVVAKALDTKGWFLTRILLSLSLTPYDPTDDMSDAARDLLANLLQEPKKS